MNLRTATIGTTALLALAWTQSSAPTYASTPVVRPGQDHERVMSGVVAVYPWSFQNGDMTSHDFAMHVADEIARKAGFTTVSPREARETWNRTDGHDPAWGHSAEARDLEAYGKAVGASEVMFGDVTWNTRSIWVGLGPKTVSTATVDAFVFDVPSNKIIYSKQNVHGRSDERENDIKIVAAVFISPLVTFVSGGPKTPQEKRAVQIALGRAYHDWVRANR
jgi:hypothetical protein